MKPTPLTSIPAKYAKRVNDRLSEKSIRADSGCIEWAGRRDLDGYGDTILITIDGSKRWTAPHRASYMVNVGDIPVGLVIDHLCMNRGCINPKHLEAVTIQENTQRGTSGTARNARKVECIRGHEFTDENTYTTPDGRRKCRECRRATQNQRNRERRSVA